MGARFPLLALCASRCRAFFGSLATQSDPMLQGTVGDLLGDGPYGRNQLDASAAEQSKPSLLRPPSSPGYWVIVGSCVRFTGIKSQKGLNSRL